MEGIDQKAVISSTVASRCGNTIVDAVPGADQPIDQSNKQSASDDPIQPEPDPTRYGDWERAGRCIDF